MNRNVVWVSLALQAVLVACGGAPAAPATPEAPASEPSTTTGSAPATPAASTPSNGESAEGGECGDDVAIQKKCAAGLVCAPKPNAPVSEHTPGVCTKQK